MSKRRWLAWTGLCVAVAVAAAAVWVRSLWVMDTAGWVSGWTFPTTSADDAEARREHPDPTCPARVANSDVVVVRGSLQLWRYVEDDSTATWRPNRRGLFVTRSRFNYFGRPASVGLGMGRGFWGRLGFGHQSSVGTNGPGSPYRSNAVAVPLWPAVLLPAIPLASRARHRRRARRRRAAARCPACGYDVRATADRCPECGEAAGVL